MKNKVNLLNVVPGCSIFAPPLYLLRLPRLDVLFILDPRVTDRALCSAGARGNPRLKRFSEQVGTIPC
jgi:hypothetical protein